MSQSNRFGNSTRNYSLDLIRTVAICFVLLLHSSAPFITLDDTLSLVANLFNTLSCPAVPLFVMLSGALMLNENKQKSTKAIYKSALQMFLLTVIWSVLYAILFEILVPIATGKDIILNGIVDVVFNGYYHMWYMYMLHWIVCRQSLSTMLC